MKNFLHTLRTFFRRVFFWLPSAPTEDEIILPDHHDHALVLNVTTAKKTPTIRQIRYMSRVLSLTEQRIVIAASLLLILSLGAAGSAFISAHSAPVPGSGGTYTEGLVGTPKYINPIDAIANDVDNDISSLVFSGLFRMHGTEIEPDLAEKYTWSDDGKVLTVTLRSDAVFHNGQPVTPEDVQFTFESIQDPKRVSPLATLFRGIVVNATDAHTIQFVLPRSDARFLTLLTTGILPTQVWQDIPAANARLADLNLKPIGSGPYRFKSFTRDSRGQMRTYTLERFDRYYGVKPLITTVTFSFFANKDEAESSLKTGNIDGLAFPTLEDWRKGEVSRWQVAHLDLPEETIAFFNLKDKALSDERVRRALVNTLDRQDVIDAWNGNGVAVSGPFPFASGATPSMTLDEARALLDTAGWSIPPGGNIRVFSKKSNAAGTASAPKKKTAAQETATTSTIASTSGTEFDLTILTSQQPELVATAETLKRRWSLLGIKVNVQSLSQDELLRRATRERKGQVIVTNILLGADQDLFPFWWSGQIRDRGLNISNLSDKNVDSALEAARNASSTPALTRAREALTAELLKINPAAFLIRPTSAYLVAPRIHGVQDRIVVSRPADRFDALRTWYIKTGWSWR